MKQVAALVVTVRQAKVPKLPTLELTGMKEFVVKKTTKCIFLQLY